MMKAAASDNKGLDPSGDPAGAQRVDLDGHSPLPVHGAGEFAECTAAPGAWASAPPR